MKAARDLGKRDDFRVGPLNSFLRSGLLRAVKKILEQSAASLGFTFQVAQLDLLGIGLGNALGELVH